LSCWHRGHRIVECGTRLALACASCGAELPAGAKFCNRCGRSSPLGPVPVKGLDGPVEIYEMTGAGPRRSRLHAAAARFVGRDAELEQLRPALARAATGHTASML
jgi:ribosomal protein L40E